MKKSVQTVSPFFLIIVTLLTSFLSTNVIAQSNSTIRVVVNSENDGNAIIGATVFLTDQSGDTLSAAVTDVYGLLEFSRLQEGNYRLRISSLGYEPKVEEVDLGTSEIKVLELYLTTDTAELGEIEVRVQRRVTQREAGKQTVSSVEVARIPSPGPGGDLTMYLQTMPSVVSTGDRGGELYIRGGTPAQNLVLVEKMPIIKPFHISNLFSAFPEAALNSVDVYAGGFGAEYSGATSAVLDVSLRQGNKREFQSEAAVSPYIVSLQAEGPIVQDQQSFMFIGRHSVIEQVGPEITGDDVPIMFYDFLGRYSFNWPGLVCNITGVRTYDRGEINPMREIQLSWDNTVLGTRCIGFSEELDNTIDFTFGYSSYNSSESGIDEIGRSSGVRMGFFRMDNETNFLKSKADYGFNLNFINYVAELDEPFVQQLGGEVRYTSLDAQMDDLVTTLSSYFSFNWELGDNMEMVTGLASQIRMRDMTPTLEPRFKFSWNPGSGDKNEVTIAAGRYMQMFEAINDERDAGTVFYVYKPVDTGDPYPESLHGILGYSREVSDNIGISIEGFVKTHKNIPVARWTREPGNTLETGRVESFGYGGDLQLEFDFYPFYLLLGYGISEVTYEGSTEELVAWVDEPTISYNPSHDKRHQLSVISSVELADFNFNLSWKYSSGGTYTKLYAYDLSLTNLPFQNPLEDQGQALTLFNRPFDGRLPYFSRLDVSVDRVFRMSDSFAIEGKVGAINTLNTRNIFYYDINTMQQVDQLPLVPYASIKLNIN